MIFQRAEPDLDSAFLYFIGCCFGGVSMKTRKWVSLLISLVMVLTMLPYYSVEVLADNSGTESDPYLVTAETTEFVDGGYYLVNSDVTNNTRIQVKGTAVLILGEGTTLTATKGIQVSDENAFLTIRGKGTLVATAESTRAAIGGSDVTNCRSIAIEGGTIRATGGQFGAGIGGGCRSSLSGTVTISGGVVTAKGGENAAGIGGGANPNWAGAYASCDNVFITGGTVTATGGSYAAGIGGGAAGMSNSAADAGNCDSVIIMGGTVVANGGENGYGIGPGKNVKNSSSHDGKAGKITLGVAGSSDSIKASSYAGTVSILDGVALTDYPIGNVYTGTLTSEQITAIAGQTLVMAQNYNKVNIASEIAHGTVIPSRSAAAEGDAVTLTVSPAEGYVFMSLSVLCEGAEVETTKVDDNTYTFSMPDKDVDVSAVFALADGFYLIRPDFDIDVINQSERFVADSENDGEYTLFTHLDEEEQIRVAKIEGGEITAFYPDTAENPYTVDFDHSGNKMLTFSQTYNDEWSDFGGYFWMEKTEKSQINVVIRNGNGVVTPDKNYAECGETVNVSVTPANGFFFSSISVTCGSVAIDVTSGEDNTYSFVMPDRQVTVEVEFVMSTDSADHTIYTEYIFGSGTDGNNNEGPKNLLDNNTATKWCISNFTGAEITFSVDQAFTPLGYILTTANDTASNPGRNPVSWTIEGKMNETDDWTTLTSVKRNTSLPTSNYTDTEFSLDTYKQCKYFRITFSELSSGTVFQLSDFRFFGESDLLVAITKREATCVSIGYSQDCWFSYSAGKYYVDQACTQELETSEVEIPATGIHTLEEHPERIPGTNEVGHIQHWTCSVCGKYFSDAAGTDEINEEDTYLYGPITYLDANGEEAVYSGDFSVVSSTDTEWKSGWWVVMDDVTIDGRPVVTGDVHLVLCDDADLVAEKGISVTTGSNSLTIYSQSLGDHMGSITTGQVDSRYAGIGATRVGSDTKTGGNGPITINGGKITATGGWGAAGIGGGQNGSSFSLITINNGYITATGGSIGAGIGTGYGPVSASETISITINGGTVIASSPTGGAGIGGGEDSNAGKITITGGNITANGGAKAAAIGGGAVLNHAGHGGAITITGGNITANAASDGTGIGAAPYLKDDRQSTNIKLSWTNLTDSITCTSYAYDTLEFEKDFIVEGGTNELATPSNINGATIVPFTETLMVVSFVYVQNGTEVFAEGSAVRGGVLSTDPGIPMRMNCQFDGWYYDNDGTIEEFVFGQTIINDDTTVFAKWTPISDQPIKYLDAEGNVCSIEEGYYILDASTAEVVLRDGWYVATHDVTLNGRTSVSGDVHLILANGVTVKAPKGIQVSAGNSLTIYQYAEQGELETVGKLIVDDPHSNFAGIGGNGGTSRTDRGDSGVITINGGYISTKGGDYASGIGGGNYGDGTVIINRGTVESVGGYDASGIGGGQYGRGTVTIKDGNINASGRTYCVGIGGGYSGFGAVSISGGTIVATGYIACGIGGGEYGGGCNVTISGGTVTAKSSGYDAAIGSGIYSYNTQTVITITGGNVTANGGEKAAGIGSGAYSSVQSITISGGVVCAYGGKNAAAIGGGASDTRGGTSYYGCANAITITGGQVQAVAGEGGIGIGSSDLCKQPGEITLGWTDTTDSITATNYLGTVKVVDGKALTDGTGNYKGSLTDTQLTAAAGKTLTPKVTAYVAGHSLTLEEGKLGLNFYVYEPSDSEGTMEFSISGRGEVVAKEGYVTENGYRVYTCYISSVQMADTVTATYTCNGESCQDTYSVQQYLAYFEAHQADYDDETITLVRAIADYGHYAQIYLKSLHKWTFDPDTGYAEMTDYYSDSFDQDSITANLGSHVLDYGNSAGIDKVSYQLYFDSAISVKIWIRLKDDAVVECDEGALQADGRYLIERTGISATELDQEINITGSCDGDFAITVSPLTYINAILTSDTTSQDAKNAVSAFYMYYEAAKAYSEK